MVRILFFIETLKAGGAEKVLCDLVNHMDQRLFDITVETVWKQDPHAFLAPGIRLYGEKEYQKEGSVSSMGSTQRRFPSARMLGR